MAFWRRIGRFGHTSYNYKCEKVFWGKWGVLNEGLRGCTLVNIQQPVNEATMRHPTSSWTISAGKNSAVQMFTSKVSCRWILGFLPEVGKDVTGQMTTRAPTLRCQTQRMALREPEGMRKGRENLRDKEMIRPREWHCQSELMEKWYLN